VRALLVAYLEFHPREPKSDFAHTGAAAKIDCGVKKTAWLIAASISGRAIHLLHTREAKVREGRKKALSLAQIKRLCLCCKSRAGWTGEWVGG